MNWIDSYIHEVTRRLPEKMRDDISLELQSTIEDMLPDHYNEDDIKNCLEKLGNPALLASRYLDRPMHLIGPRYFDLYVTLLKTILPIAAIISFIALTADHLTEYIGDKSAMDVALSIIGEGIYKMIEVGMTVFFWLTIAFAIMERVDTNKDGQPYTTRFSKWQPDDLKSITHIPKKKAIPRIEVYGSLFWTAIWGTIYFYADHLIGIYEGGRDKLEFVAPAFNQEVLLHYWPMVLIMIVAEITLALYKLAVKQWTNKLALFNTGVQIIATIFFMVMIMDPAIFNTDFLSYLADLFSITASELKQWIINIVAIIFIVSAVLNTIDGFRKARVQNALPNRTTNVKKPV
ncbi:hypothetical protein [Bacillus sp. 1P06AnD]|uniref:hypothetical protein n=1 Tax=Bacillus sp. 1P06AnD TaxID=3132208 RepID=UPI0039A1C46D